MPTGVRRSILAIVSYFEQFDCLSSGLEHIILSHMAKHLFLNNILIDQQHGFREKFSGETQLISAIHDWAKGINFRSQTDVILLDFSKAFDSVPHDRLVVKLDFHGIRGKMLNWIRAFLTNRKQKVSVNAVLSLSSPVVSGVTQGSVLGLVLFLLFINDISNSIHSNLRLFANDCVLYKEVATQQDCQIVQQDLHLLPHWPKTWQLSFNVSKCCHRGITRKKTPLNLIIPWMASLSQELLLQCISGYHASLVCVFPFRGSLPFIISR